MKLCKSIQLDRPIRHVRLASVSSPADAEQSRRQSEQDIYERGRRDGEKALGELLMQQRTELLQLQQGVLDSLRAVVPKLTRDTEKSLVQLALELSQKIIAGLPVDAPMVEAVVREALAHVEDDTEINVQLHPEDLALLRKHQSTLLDGLPETGPLHFSQSTEVSRGGCLVHTRFGMVDARRETKIEQLRNALPV